MKTTTTTNQVATGWQRIESGDGPTTRRTYDFAIVLESEWNRYVMEQEGEYL